MVGFPDHRQVYESWRILHLLGPEEQDPHTAGKMDPSNTQCSIDYLFSNNAVVCPGLTLPRSFTRVRHESVCYGAFAILSITLSPSQSFTRSNHKKQAYGVPADLSKNHFRTSTLGFLSLTSVGGNSRALVLAIIRRNQTRILFVWDSVQAFLGGVIAAHQAEAELDVPYTVIRAHSLMSETFALNSDYLKDFNSFCFTGEGAHWNRFMDEFTSHSTRLKTTLDEKRIRRG